MGKGSHAIRWAVVAFAAYALFLQSLTMAVAASRAVGDPGSFVSLCSGTMMLDPTAPEEGGTRLGAGPCALCGLGHVVLDLPAFFSLPLPRNVVETHLVLPLREPEIRQSSFIPVGAPRGPPVFI